MSFPRAGKTAWASTIKVNSTSKVDFAATFSQNQAILNRTLVVSEENIGRVLSGNRVSAILGHSGPVFGPAEIADLIGGIYLYRVNYFGLFSNLIRRIPP